MRHELANHIPQELRQTVRDFQQHPGASIEKLADSLGLGITYENLPYGQEGYLEQCGRGESPSGYMIVVNAGSLPARRRWTIAHEIGHFVLHDLDETRYRGDMYDSRAKQIEERQANQFSADLLISFEALDSALHPDVQPYGQPLHEIFKVSEEAMSRQIAEYRAANRVPRKSQAKSPRASRLLNSYILGGF